MGLDIAKVRKRADKAFEEKNQSMAYLEDAYRFALPQRNLYNQNTKGVQKNSHLFESTLLTSTRKSANKFVNLMFPAFQNWLKVEAGERWNDNKDFKNKLNKQLQDRTEKIFDIIHHRSNFQSAIGEMTLDMLVSNGIMTTQKGTLKEPVNYQAVPQLEVALELGPGGSDGGKYRKFKVQVGMIEATWPDAKLTKEMIDCKKEDPSKEYELVEALYIDYDTEQIYYDVLVKGEGEAHDRIVERELRRDPYIVGRMMRSANEANGRGPVLDALPDAKTINKLVELTLKNATLAVSGVYTVVDDGVVNPENVKISPLSFIPVARNAGHPAGPSIAPLGRSGDFDVSYLEQQRLVDSIKKTMMDNELPPLTGQPRTAAEIISRIRQFADDQGATFGRITRDVVAPIWANTDDILTYDWGILDPIQGPDGEPLKLDGESLTLKVTSPLAQQQNLNEVESLTQAIEISRALFGPQITALNFKMEEIPAWIGRKLGVDEDLINDDTTRKQGIDAAGTAIAEVEGNNPGAGLGLVNQALQGN